MALCRSYFERVRLWYRAATSGPGLISAPPNKNPKYTATLYLTQLAITVSLSDATGLTPRYASCCCLD